MAWLNYHHLLYFWTAAREGGVTRAAEKLGLSSPTISAQIRELEGVLGEPLFHRVGRRLVLTETGHVVLRYADEIFALGREMMDAVKVGTGVKPTKLVVGIADQMPKLITRALLEPATKLEPAVTLVCHEDKVENLINGLANYRLDVVLSDTPAPAASQIKTYNHLLGECGVSFFGASPLVTKYRKGFPESLDGAPVYLPTRTSALRRSLDQYFDTSNIRPRVVGEFDDSAMLKAFGEVGGGLFPAPALSDEDVQRAHGVKKLGTIEGVRERFYAISPERRLKHPAVVAICATAREEFFR